ncbi:hypothetical protein IW262DRAFT_1331502 [Armillaria fumosa]|nr:hypothetical protein IW262DRAFT_1331502 [Armillaria fumosa]
MNAKYSRARSESPVSDDSFDAAYRLGFKSRRRAYINAAVLLTFLSLMTLVSFSFWTASPTASRTTEPSHDSSNLDTLQPDVLDPSNYVLGAPTEHFRDNLRPDVQYITSWISAGWTNDVMTYVNLIYLGMITDRVPVIPMFTPSHIGGSVPPIAFGDVFDVPRLRKALNKPIIEWRDVKDPGSNQLDNLGCWNVWESSQFYEPHPRGSPVLYHLGLDISYTKMPGWIKLYQDYEHDYATTFWALARFAYPETRNANLVTPLPSPATNVSLPPDEQMLCYDYLYYVCAQQSNEWELDFSPAWRFVAQYMHWVPSLERLASVYINRALGYEDDELTPPYISVHVRHYDFDRYCVDMPLTDCFASIPVIARRVQEVKDELMATKGQDIKHVVVTSDERNASWWQEVAEQGWFAPDHSRTKELLGDWYPVLIDAAIQSGGVGFVGTDRSTMSLLARRRVETWQNGVTRTVRWGHPGADDH